MPKPLKDPVTVERLRELLNYDPDTGEVRWRMATSNRVKAGDRTAHVAHYGDLSPYGDNHV